MKYSPEPLRHNLLKLNSSWCIHSNKRSWVLIYLTSLALGNLCQECNFEGHQTRTLWFSLMLQQQQNILHFCWSLRSRSHLQSWGYLDFLNYHVLQIFYSKHTCINLQRTILVDRRIHPSYKKILCYFQMYTTHLEPSECLCLDVMPS